VRYRRKGTQALHLEKGKELKHLLLQWFIDYRKSIKGRIWPRTVLIEARRIKDRLVAWYRENGRTLPPMPHVDIGPRGKRWLRRWKVKNHITFKKSGRKFKVSRPKLLRRTKTTWLNSWSAMLIFNLLFKTARAKKGKPAYPYMQTGDQKGTMINEPESVNAPTLAFEGIEDSGIKTNHGQSRKRMSLMTLVTNDPGYAPPLEMCFKLKTGRCLMGLVLPTDIKLTLAHSKSGSYNYETMMAYLDKHLPLWTEERAAINDYRVFFLDDYAVHNMKDISDLCWSRGFLKIKIGGGCTFILCNCDLDLHADLARDYLEMDVDWAAAELKDKPWRVPDKSRQAVVDDWSCIWYKFPHARRGVDSFKYSGLGARPPARTVRADGSWEVPLSGPDDWMINRDAREFFVANNMQLLRKECLTKIYEDFDAGKITDWSDVRNYQRDHSDSEHGGEHGEGDEVLSEKPLSDGSETDLDEEDPDIVHADHDSQVEADGANATGEALVAGALDETAIVAHESDDAVLKDLRIFDELIDRARAIANPRVTGMLMQQKKEKERSLRGLDRDAIRQLDEERAASLAELAIKRAALHAADVESQKKRALERDQKKQKEAEAAKRREEQAALKKKQLLLDKIDWTPEEFGHGEKGTFDKSLTRKVRSRVQEALERTCFLSPVTPRHLTYVYIFISMYIYIYLCI
jgi:hypothetical protein